MIGIRPQKGEMRMLLCSILISPLFLIIKHCSQNIFPCFFEQFYKWLPSSKIVIGAIPYYFVISLFLALRIDP
ncbi:hypothetical protein ABIC55_001011 [Sporosarcina psychrophila]|uniref:Uncharacterized protein n=1 Tax=Sporosarcina psychrophila TaxID=1476 RepID=A0ABV2K4B6_SPOPS